jgi:tRNA dimethylallyltransferase
VSPLVVIVGPTASGKSALAFEVAERHNGEIICADSRTVYKGMNIGTAKPSTKERNRIPHHMLDIIVPSQPYSVANFKHETMRLIDEVHQRGRLPIMVGGTGLYIDAVLFNFNFNLPASPLLRAELSSMNVEQLQERVLSMGLDLPANAQNPRHLMRVIETNGAIATHGPIRDNTVVIGLAVDRKVLRRRVTHRVHEMIAQGFLDEVRQLAAEYGWDAPGMLAPGYKAFRAHINGEATLDEAIALFIRNDMKLAKRQMTWFKRNDSIQWLQSRDQALLIIEQFLAKQAS